MKWRGYEKRGGIYCTEDKQITLSFLCVCECNDNGVLSGGSDSGDYGGLVVMAIVVVMVVRRWSKDNVVITVE